MSLEEAIVEWAATRPAWQRAVLRRVAMGEAFSEKGYDELVNGLLTSHAPADEAFGLEHLPHVEVGAAPVILVSLANPEHVNALTSDQPLTFEPTGLTVVYGDNGSGKSGYARLLKRIARARHREEILSDVFRDTALAIPKAAVTIKVGDKEQSLAWPDSTPPELQRMLYYDAACGEAYAATESDFPYRPSALFVMDGLIEACIAVRNRLDAKLDQNARSAKNLPAVAEEVRDTAIGRFLSSLSSGSSIEALNKLLEGADTSATTLDDLKDQESRLRTADTSRERQRLARQSAKLSSLRGHIEGIQAALGDDAVATLQEERDRLTALQQASALLARTFDGEPLSGTGTGPWKELWEAARGFSEAQAYPGESFPFVAADAKCVLCQQPLQDEARQRLSRFERFVRDDTQTKLREARSAWDSRVGTLSSLEPLPEAIDTHLKDLEADEAQLVHDVRSLLAKYGAARTNLLNALPGTTPLPHAGVTVEPTLSRLGTAAVSARAKADGLSDPETIRASLAAVTAKRKELELFIEVKRQRQLVLAEIERLKDRDLLEGTKNAAATGPITKKVLELSEDNITEVVRDTFTRETERLRLDRVTMAKTRGERGALLHQPKLVGARQNVTLPRVFSEGERTALGLAAFFTEAQLHASKSALILDDPVSSLDHIRRRLVATRLAELAQTHQVVVFTHDVAFVADLKREAKGLAVSVGERSVRLGRGGERKPGACSSEHPWKARDVKERLGVLRAEFARIKRDAKGWDESTYENEVATWAGNLSETWERIFSQEVVGPVLAEGGLEVRPHMVKVIARFSDTDDREFQASYSRVSLWAKRHDKSGLVNYVAPGIDELEKELALVDNWFNRVKAYKN